MKRYKASKRKAAKRVAKRNRKRAVKFDINELRKKLRPALSWTFKIAVTCLFAFVFVWYLGQKVSMVGDSMNPVLSNGDVTLVNRIVYNASAPKRGDVIAFKPKGNENSHYYIKRIIGLPGETVAFVEGDIYIDGTKLEEDYETTEIEDVGSVTEEITLDGDEYFVLGDNRKNSEDSRMADVGMVKRSYIYGKVWMVLAPREHVGLVKR